MTPNKASRPAKYQYSSPLKSVATDSQQVMTRSQERRDSSGKNRKKTKLFPVKKGPPGKDSNSPSEFDGVAALPETPRLPSLPETPQVSVTTSTPHGEAATPHSWLGSTLPTTPHSRTTP